MAPPTHTETAAVVAQVPPPVEHAGAEQEMPPMGLSKVAAPALGGGPSAGGAPPANFSEAIDRIGLGPFQTRIVIMCGMVRQRAVLYVDVYHEASSSALHFVSPTFLFQASDVCLVCRFAV